MPTITETLSSGKTRLRVDPIGVAAILRVHPNARVLLERVSARPGEGSVSSHALGRACGIVQGVCAGLGLPVREITPQAWRHAAGLPRGLSRTAGKTASRHIAATRFPNSAASFARVKDDGRAEAALLADLA